MATHPGEFLRELLEEMEVSQGALAEHCKIPVQRINEIIIGKRGITADIAWLLGQAFGTSPESWMNLQAQHDLTKARPTSKLPKLKAAPDGARLVQLVELALTIGMGGRRRRATGVLGNLALRNEKGGPIGPPLGHRDRRRSPLHGG
jgi:antitoxin HigA-1